MNKDRKKILLVGFLILLVTISVINRKRQEEEFNLSEELSYLDDKLEKREESNNEEKDTKGYGGEEKESLIVVHIDGQINKPGVYTLSYGSRLNDLLNAAQGFTDDAYTRDVNLALILEDEMKIYIPNIKDIDIQVDTELIIPKIEEGSGNTSKVNLNKASLEELTSLPNIGPSKAQDIINYREENKFYSKEDLLKVKGIGEKTFEKLKELIVVK